MGRAPGASRIVHPHRLPAWANASNDAEEQDFPSVMCAEPSSCPYHSENVSDGHSVRARDRNRSE